MPTYSRLARFIRDFEKLSAEDKVRFVKAVRAFVDDLAAGNGFRAGLRVKKMHGHEDIWELSWAPDGRATFSYGDPIRAGHVHIVWHRVGTHDIYTQP
jgi:hypothetical protein